MRYARKTKSSGIHVNPIMAVPRSSDYCYCVDRGIIKNRLDHIRSHWYEPPNMTSMPNCEFYALVVRSKIHNIGAPSKAVLSVCGSVASFVCPHCGHGHSIRRWSAPWWSRRRVLCRVCHGQVDVRGNVRAAFDWLVVALTPRAAWVFRIGSLVRRVRRSVLK